MNTPIISVNELQELLEEDKPVFVLDVRPKDQRDEWKIAGSHYLDAYKPLNAGDQTVFDDLDIPADIPVVTVCAAGKTSQIAANILKEKGFMAYSLEDGMKAWNYAWNTAEVSKGDMKLVQVRRVAKGCISYIIGSQGEAIVVDASLDPQVYLDIAVKHNWEIKYVMDTHIHADYISRTTNLARITGAKHLFTENAEVDYDFHPLRDGDVISVGSARVTAVHTPGHTPESVSFLINGRFLLTGDTLFTDGVGRPDLKADPKQGLQKASQLFDSLQKILAIDKDLVILPAHTSQPVAFDKKLIAGKLSSLVNDLELLQLQKDDFIEQIVKRIPPPPPNYLRIAAINKTGNSEGIEPADLEAGANRCAVS